MVADKPVQHWVIRFTTKVTDDDPTPVTKDEAFSSLAYTQLPGVETVLDEFYEEETDEGV